MRIYKSLILGLWLVWGSGVWGVTTNGFQVSFQPAEIVPGSNACLVIETASSLPVYFQIWVDGVYVYGEFLDVGTETLCYGYDELLMAYGAVGLREGGILEFRYLDQECGYELLGSAFLKFSVLPCQLWSLSQGGWGNVSVGSPLTGDWFRQKFPQGLSIGANGNWVRFSSPEAIRAVLPASGVPARLKSGVLTDPSRKRLNNTLAGQAIALTLNVALSPDFSHSIVQSGPCANLTVEQVLELANNVLGNGASKGVLSALTSTMDSINRSWDGGQKRNDIVRCNVSR